MLGNCSTGTLLRSTRGVLPDRGGQRLPRPAHGRHLLIPDPVSARPRLRQANAGRGSRAGLRTPARTGGHHLSLARQPRVAGRLPRAAVVTVTADGVRLSSAIDVLLPNIRWDES